MKTIFIIVVIVVLITYIIALVLHRKYVKRWKAGTYQPSTGVPKMKNPPKPPTRERYQMCKPQPVQLDCRKEECVYHHNGACTNLAPAVTLNQGDNLICWSFKNKTNP